MKAWLGVVLGVVISISLVLNAYQVWKFISAGPRFTAYDGQELCERIAAHERFHGLPANPCKYAK